MSKVPASLHDYINNAFPTNVILVGTSGDDGYTQISPRGSVIVWDEQTIGFWNRGTGKTYNTIVDGTKVTFFYRNTDLRDQGLLPKGGIARFYGVAKVYPTGEVRDQVYDKMAEAERQRDPKKLGGAVLVFIERAEDLSGDSLDIE